MRKNAVLPRTMRAAVMYDVDDIRIEERPLPELEPGDALVRTAASGVCSGDLMPWYVRKKAPFVFGHEPAGTVVALAGDAATAADGREVAVGDRVFAHHHAPCLACDACRLQRYVHCATWRATSLDPGGMAEFFRVPRANLKDTRVLPAAFSFLDGSLVEPLGCVVKSLRRAFPLECGVSSLSSSDAGRARGNLAHVATTPRFRFGEGCLSGRSLYVIGAGVMGLMHVAVAAALGATAYAGDYHPARRARAEQLGAVAAYEPGSALEALRLATGGAGADVVVCGPGSSAALQHALEATAADGTVLMFTPLEPSERFDFDQSRAYFRDLRLVSSYSCGPNDTAEAVRLLAASVISARSLGATQFPFPSVAEAYDAMKSASVVKAIVTFQAEEAS